MGDWGLVDAMGTDRDLMDAWWKRLMGQAEGIASNALAILVLVDLSKRRPDYSQQLFADLSRFRRISLEMAVQATCHWLSPGRIRRTSKLELIRILIVS